MPDQSTGESSSPIPNEQPPQRCSWTEWTSHRPAGMCSSAINPDTGMAMFESGAGTAPTLAGKNKANPIGRILTAAMMLRHIGAEKGADAIEQAVQEVLAAGWRTEDLASDGEWSEKIIGTAEMGEKIISNL